MLSLFFHLLLLASAARAAFYDSLEDLPTRKFDFIVVGGGTAGNVIANRLTEISHFSVLVLEAGGSDKDALLTQVPFFCNRLATSQYNWNFTTAPIEGLNGRAIAYPRGFIIGGSSSINFMGYTRGSSDDYNRYASITRDAGWSWDKLQPYIRKNERFVQPVDHHNTSGEYNPTVHGYHGINTVSLPGYPHEIDPLVLETLEELSDEFPYNEDTNSGYQLGMGWVQSTIKNGTRSSSSTSYLASKYSQRPNLHVLLNTRVTRLAKSSGSKKLTFRTVEFTRDGGASVQTLSAIREIVLSAGSIGTPAILLHSGIGDSAALSPLGITSTLHLPSVGQNLTEHPVVSNAWFVNSANTNDEIIRNITLQNELLDQWKESRTGPMVTNLMGFLGWFRLPETSPIFENFTDPAAGPNTGHFEYIVSNGMTRLPAPATGNFLGFSMVAVTPLSRGSIYLNSSNPLDPPIINPNLLASPFDLFVLRSAYRKTALFTSASPWKGYLINPVNNVSTNASDDEIDAFIRSNAAAIYHPVGTAAMSAQDADYGVVDPDLKVKGVLGLRIVDASVLPFVPAAHTQAVTYIFAERGADIIKGDYGEQ
ncbi:aryl-alcohol oxidase precursor [Mycena floridula]|nr:aryl-alcohol oxidase precursor [Mycena floridula]